MSKLRFQIALPMLQFPAALTVLLWGRRIPQPAGIDFPYSPTIVLVCRGLNAPATFCSVILESLLPLDRPDRTPVSILGFGVQDVMFLLGVIVLWHFVGRAIDNRRKPQRARLTRMWSKAALNLILMFFSAVLFRVGMTSIVDRGNFANRTGSAVMGTLFTVWALVLFLFSALRLVREFRMNQQVYPEPRT